MPRRIPDYPDSFSGWNAISSLGSLISVVAIIVFGYVLYDMFVNGKLANNNPWAVPQYFTDSHTFNDISNNSSTIEWTLKSPIPLHAFNMLPIQS